MQAGTIRNRRQLTADAYTIAIIYVKPIEMGAITAMIDEFHLPIPLHISDTNEYTLGRIGSHNVAIAGPAKGMQGKVAIASVATRIPFTFRNIRISLVVGIGGGIPRSNRDVRLGDVVVGAPEYGDAVVQYDLGKEYTHRMVSSRSLNKPPDILLRVVDRVNDEYHRAKLGEDLFDIHMKQFEKFPKIKEQYQRPKAVDRLFKPDFEHSGSPYACHPEGTTYAGDTSSCSEYNSSNEVRREPREPGLGGIKIHYGTILSGDRVMKSGKKRDEIASNYPNALCFEMEAAGVMNDLPCLVIRGICDYSDSHKNKEWQGYAAATAASYAREVLLTMAERVGGDLDGRTNTGLPSRSVTWPSADTNDKNTPSQPLWGGDYFDNPLFTPPSSGSQTPTHALWGGDFFDGPQFKPLTSTMGMRKTYTYYREGPI
ncbi:SH3 and multiple ankyrin repeat domains protein 2 [Arthrobotrys conoides]|uniref:SH3 and multiple ankyrin repeat domains protein 2 n=1 Tax=Arthrobotrys conoides TaxID=74498 RepID=A0AAN8NSZ4_9PEZI